MLRAGSSWSKVQAATGCSRATTLLIEDWDKISRDLMIALYPVVSSGWRSRMVVDGQERKGMLGAVWGSPGFVSMG